MGVESREETGEESREETGEETGTADTSGVVLENGTGEKTLRRVDMGFLIAHTHTHPNIVARAQ